MYRANVWFAVALIVNFGWIWAQPAQVAFSITRHSAAALMVCAVTAGLAQLVVQLTLNQRVAGSIPASPTKFPLFPV